MERERERERERWCSLNSWVTVVGGSREGERERDGALWNHALLLWVGPERERESVVGPDRESVCVVFRKRYGKEELRVSTAFFACTCNCTLHSCRVSVVAAAAGPPSLFTPVAVAVVVGSWQKCIVSLVVATTYCLSVCTTPVNFVATVASCYGHPAAAATECGKEAWRRRRSFGIKRRI